MSQFTAHEKDYFGKSLDVAIRLALIALIISGAIGLYLVELASARLIRVVRALTLADQ